MSYAYVVTPYLVIPAQSSGGGDSENQIIASPITDAISSPIAEPVV